MFDLCEVAVEFAAKVDQQSIVRKFQKRFDDIFGTGRGGQRADAQGGLLLMGAWVARPFLVTITRRVWGRPKPHASTMAANCDRSSADGAKIGTHGRGPDTPMAAAAPGSPLALPPDDPSMAALRIQAMTVSPDRGDPRRVAPAAGQSVRRDRGGRDTA